jgi:hypothetical protein
MPAGSTSGPWAFQVQAGQSSGTTATSTTNNNQMTPVTLNVGEWYQFTVDILRTPTANTWSVGGSLQAFGADGLTPGQTFTFAPANISGNAAEIWNDTSVYAAWRSHAVQGGADLLDNFSVTQAPVPEPASIGMLGLAGAAMLRRKRK